MYGSTLLIDVLNKYKNKVFVETGTNSGRGVRTAVHCGFTHVISIEIDESYQDNNNKIIDEFPNLEINLITGDVIDEFPKVLDSLNERATFFLDAHWDFGVKGKTVCSLDYELDLIAKHKIKEHTILIDDRRCFTGSHHWGSGINEERIIEKLTNINPDYTITYEDNRVAKNDMIVAYL